jgi:hypothetical protein
MDARIRFLAVVVALALSPCFPAHAERGDEPQNEYSLPTTAFDAVLAEAKKVVAGRTMSPPGACAPHEVAGYDGLPTQLCSYADRGRPARVVLLDPDAILLTRWTVYACQIFDYTAFGRPSTSFLKQCGRKVLKLVAKTSHGHFPVAGVVYRDGKAYAFRDGMTVTVDGFANGDTQPLSETQIEAALQAPVKAWSGAAYPHGATYADYAAYGRLHSADGKFIDDSHLTYPQLVAQRHRTERNYNFNSLLRAAICPHSKSWGFKMHCLKLPPDVPGAARNQ